MYQQLGRAGTGAGGGDVSVVAAWERVQARSGVPPCKRSLHAAAVWQDNLIVFGGYDGHQRVNDLYIYNFARQMWSLRGQPPPPNVLMSPAPNPPPSPRDRHVAVVWGNGFFIFGGFDGSQRVNDMHVFDLETNTWGRVLTAQGNAPTPRHSHAAVVYRDSMYVFGGYDGSYRCDFHEFNFLTRQWTIMPSGGDVPRPRYRGTCVVHEDRMILHGGHDGSRHLQDTYIYDFEQSAWQQLITDGHIPSPRDSHVAVVYGRSMFIFGGSTGQAMNDFHELRLDTGTWRSVPVTPLGGLAAAAAAADETGGPGGRTPRAGAGAGAGGTGGTPQQAAGAVPGSPMPAPLPPPPPASPPPSPLPLLAPAAPLSPQPGGMDSFISRPPLASVGSRFCHVGVVHDRALYVFGGYDGNNRLNDFLRLEFPEDEPTMEGIPPSTLVADLKKLVNCDLLSDISFIVEGQRVLGHKVLCLRCPFFHNMLTGEYMESRATELPIDDIRLPIFLQLMEFLYSDSCEISLESAMELLRAADRFGVDRLKRLCENAMLSSISVDTAPQILLASDAHNAEALRERCMAFILNHFDNVSQTPAFEEMTRANLELTLEILKRRVSPR